MVHPTTGILWLISFCIAGTTPEPLTQQPQHRKLQLHCCSDSSALLQWHQKLTQQPMTPKAALLQWQQCAVAMTAVRCCSDTKSCAVAVTPKAHTATSDTKSCAVAVTAVRDADICKCRTYFLPISMTECTMHCPLSQITIRHYKLYKRKRTPAPWILHTHSLSNKNKHAHWWYKL
jgi:hypothetical protein